MSQSSQLGQALDWIRGQLSQSGQLRQALDWIGGQMSQSGQLGQAFHWIRGLRASIRLNLRPEGQRCKEALRASIGLDA